MTTRQATTRQITGPKSQKTTRRALTIQEVVDGTGGAPEVQATKELKWKRKLGLTGGKRGEFVLVGYESNQTLWRKLSGADKVWTGDRPKDSPDTLYLAWIPTDVLASKFGYEGQADIAEMPFFIAGKVNAIVRNLVQQHVIPKGKEREGRELVEDWSFNVDMFTHGADQPNPDFDAEGKYKESAHLGREYYDILELEEQNKKDNTIDYDQLVAALAVADASRTNTGKKEITVYDVNGKPIVTADKDLTRPAHNVVLTTIAGMKDQHLFKAGGGLDISWITQPTGKHRFEVKIIKNPERKQSGGKRGKFPLPFGVEFSVVGEDGRERDYDISPYGVFLHAVEDLDAFVDELKGATGKEPDFYEIIDKKPEYVGYEDVKAQVRSDLKQAGAKKAAPAKRSGKKTSGSEKSEKSGEK